MQEFPQAIFEGLTDEELRGLLTIIHYASEAKTEEDVRRVLRLLQWTFRGSFVLGEFIMPADINPKHFPGWEASPARHRVVNIGDPPKWMRGYTPRDDDWDNPVMRRLSAGNFVHTWDELYAKPERRPQRVLFDRARRQGMLYGVTVGYLHQESQWASILSCAWHHAGEERRLKLVIDYITHRIHEALISNLRLIQSSGERQTKRRITNREKEVMLWVCAGKTNAEIGRILGITERTVKFHVSSLFGKLHITKRSSLVAEAIRRGWL